LLRYTDDGWSSVSLSSVSNDWWLNGVHFTAPDNGWIVGSDWYHERGVLLQYISSAPISLLPDLTGNWMSMEQTCKQTKRGMKCNIKGILAIQNLGFEDAYSSSVRIYLSDDHMYDEGDTFLKQISAGKRLKAGRFKNKKLKYKMTYDETATDKYIIAVIDEDNSVEELNENNNIIVYGPFS